MNTLIAGLTGIGRYGLWVRDFCRALAAHGPPTGQTLAEAFRIGIKSLPILLIIAAFVGTNLLSEAMVIESACKVAARSTERPTPSISPTMS